MSRIDPAFEHLQVIALLKEQTILPVLVADPEKLQVRQLGHLWPAPHVGPDDTAAFDAGISRMMNALGERQLGRNVRHLQTFANRRKFPAVINAAQAIFLDPAVKQRRQPVWAKGTDQTEHAVLGAKQHQIFTEQFDPHRPAAGLLHIRRRCHGYPVLAEQIAHQRSGATRVSASFSSLVKL